MIFLEHNRAPFFHPITLSQLGGNHNLAFGADHGSGSHWLTFLLDVSDLIVAHPTEPRHPISRCVGGFATLDPTSFQRKLWADETHLSDSLVSD